MQKSPSDRMAEELTQMVKEVKAAEQQGYEVKRDTAIREVYRELERATQHNHKFHSPHEGYAVLKEEVDELWDEVKRNAPMSVLRLEAVQAAAMALRFLIDCT